MRLKTSNIIMAALRVILASDILWICWELSAFISIGAPVNLWCFAPMAVIPVAYFAMALIFLSDVFPEENEDELTSEIDKIRENEGTHF